LVEKANIINRLSTTIPNTFVEVEGFIKVLLEITPANEGFWGRNKQSALTAPSDQLVPLVLIGYHSIKIHAASTVF